ncbi:MAG TPA: YeeE/YedE thiosulfate transporter family protein [Polyangiaceae bacterium]
MSSDFTPWSSLAGGVLIGLATAVLLLVNGRTAGVSGMLSGVIQPVVGDVAWRVLFLVGLVAAGVFALLLQPGSIEPAPRSLAVLAVAGFLVGVGTRWSRGCTSGHGVCGLARGSARSLAATCVFVGTGMLTAGIFRLLGGSP